NETVRSTCELAVESASPSDPEHVLFLGRMLSFLSFRSSDERPLAVQLLASHATKLLTLALVSPEAQVDWGVVFLNLGRRDLALQCFLSAKPNTPGRARTVIRGLEELGKSAEAIV